MFFFCLFVCKARRDAGFNFIDSKVDKARQSRFAVKLRTRISGHINVFFSGKHLAIC